MKKIIKLTESDLRKIVRRVLMEDMPELPQTKNAPLGKVEAIQQALMNAGYNVGPTGVDGKFGRNTRAAVKKFQRDNGLTVDGIVGRNTASKLGVQPLIGGNITPSTQNLKKSVDPKITQKSNDSLLSTNIDTGFKNKFNINALSDKDSTFVCKAGQENCGQFVNDFSKKLSYVGNAWLAHDLDRVGKRIMSSYTSLNPRQVEKIFNIFKQIEKQGGPKERKSGGQVENIKLLQQELIKPVSPSNLKVDDVVGIYYPPSGHHEEAFHEAGKPYFVSDGKGGWKMGKTISSGKGFGMNTHVGIIGGVKNGVPLVFHNIGGDVYSDPYNKIRNGGKIVWVKR